jgi:hypothetical protein
MNKRKRTNEPTLLMIHETLIGHLSFYSDDEEGLERAKKQLIKGAKEFKKHGFEKDISSNLTIMRVSPGKLKKYDDKWDFPVVFWYDNFEFDESDDDEKNGELKENKSHDNIPECLKCGECMQICRCEDPIISYDNVKKDE